MSAVNTMLACPNIACTTFNSTPRLQPQASSGVGGQQPLTHRGVQRRPQRGADPLHHRRGKPIPHRGGAARDRIEHLLHLGRRQLLQQHCAQRGLEVAVDVLAVADPGARPQAGPSLQPVLKPLPYRPHHRTCRICLHTLGPAQRRARCLPGSEPTTTHPAPPTRNMLQLGRKVPAPMPARPQPRTAAPDLPRGTRQTTPTPLEHRTRPGHNHHLRVQSHPTPTCSKKTSDGRRSRHPTCPPSHPARDTLGNAHGRQRKSPQGGANLFTLLPLSSRSAMSDAARKFTPGAAEWSTTSSRSPHIDAHR